MLVMEDFLVIAIQKNMQYLTGLRNSAGSPYKHLDGKNLTHLR
jgi:hypothetical protein